MATPKILSYRLIDGLRFVEATRRGFVRTRKVTDKLAFKEATKRGFTRTRKTMDKLLLDQRVSSKVTLESNADAIGLGDRALTRSTAEYDNDKLLLGDNVMTRVISIAPVPPPVAGLEFARAALDRVLLRESISSNPQPGGSSGISVAWTAPNDVVDTYTMFLGTKTRDYDNTISGIVSTSIGLPALTQGERYFGVVAGVLNGNVGFWSREFSFIVPKVGRKFYVSTTGNDGAAGTEAAPWASISKACSAAVAGDTVFFRGGTYLIPASAIIYNNHNGAPGNWITFRNYPGETVVWDGRNVTGAFSAAFNIQSNTSYIRFQGINCTAAGYWFFYTKMSDATVHHIEWYDFEGYSNGAQAWWLEGGGTGTALFHTVANAILHDNGGAITGGMTIWPTGTGASQNGYVRVEGVRVYNQAQQTSNYDGIQIGGNNGGTNHIVVADCEGYACGGTVAGPDCLDLGGHGHAHHYLVERCYLHDFIGPGAFKCHAGYKWNPPGGLGYTDGISCHHIVRRNIHVGNSHFEDYGFPLPLTMYNNLYFDGQRRWFMYNQDAGVHDPTSLGDTTYASWLATTGQTDTATGRFEDFNNAYFQNAPSSGNVVTWDMHGSVMLVTRDSIRGHHNGWKIATGQNWTWGGSQYTTLAAWQGHSSLPEQGSTALANNYDPALVYRNVANLDFQLIPGSPWIGKGTSHTRTLNAGVNSKTLLVDRASVFCDGYLKNGERVTATDIIQIGADPANQFEIDSIGESTDPTVFNTITLQTAGSWNVGDPVYLVDIETRLPLVDLGPYPYTPYTRPMRPTNVTVTVS